MTAPFTGRPVRVSGMLVLQRPGIDPIYDGPIDDPIDDPNDDLLPTPLRATKVQLAAIDRVIGGSTDPGTLLKQLRGGHPHFGNRLPSAQAPGPGADAYPLAIPTAAMYGWAAQKCATIGAPLGWAYTAMLAFYAAHADVRAEGSDLQPTLYVAHLGNKGVGKSRTQTRTRKVFGDCDRFVESGVPGSDRGLCELFAADDQVGSAPSKLLLQDELRQMLSKIAIQNSSLSHVLCTLFNDTQTSSAVKNKVSQARVKLNILGAVKTADPQEFRELFGSETTAGLYDRFIFVPGPNRWEWDDEWHPVTEMNDWDGEGTMIPASLPTGSRVRIPSAVYHRLKAWRRAAAQGADRGRLGEIALRVAVISAAANGDAEITEECFSAALVFGEWQERVRAMYSPSEAKTPDATVTDLIMEAMTAQEAAQPGQYVRFWDVARSRNWGRKYGSATVTRTKTALIADGYLEEESVSDDKGNVKRVYQARLRLRTA